MSKTFTQSQWGRVNGVSMAEAGCGPCSLAAIVYNLIMSITPKKTAEWLAKGTAQKTICGQTAVTS